VRLPKNPLSEGNVASRVAHKDRVRHIHSSVGGKSGVTIDTLRFSNSKGFPAAQRP
jgi:hypothetical protein